MKKIIRWLIIIMIMALCSLSFFALGEYRFFKLIYNNAIIADVSFEQQDDFDTLIKMAEEYEISVIQANEVSGEEIDLVMPYYCMKTRFAMKSGRYPGENEFISDLDSGDALQSGIIKRISPFRVTKVYNLSEAEHLHFSSQYIFSCVSMEKIEDLFQKLPKSGIKVEIMAEVNPWMVFFSKDWLYRDRFIIGLCLICSFSFFNIFIAAIITRSKQEINSQNEKYGCRERIKEILLECFFNKKTVLLLILVYMTLFILLAAHGLWSFWIFGTLLFCASVLAIMLIQIIIFVALSIITKCCDGLTKMLRGRKESYAARFVVGILVKTIWALAIMITIPFVLSVIKNCNIEKKNIGNFKENRNIFKVSLQYVGQDESLEKEVELQKIIDRTYKELTSKNNAFFMDSESIKMIEAMGLSYAPNGIVSPRGDETHITVSPNYFSFNPIFSANNEPVRDLISYETNVLNLLVPESELYLEDALAKQFHQFFDFNRFKIYERVYKNAENDSWNPMDEELIINIIPVKNGQTYYSFSDYIHKNERNGIKDPTVVVYTGNFHPSYVLSTASNSFFFQYDKDEDTVNGYLNQVSGLAGFLKAESIFGLANRKLRMHKTDVVLALMWLTLNVFGYFIACMHFKKLINGYVKNRFESDGAKRRLETIKSILLLLLQLLSVVLPVLGIVALKNIRILQMLRVELRTGIVAIVILEVIGIVMNRVEKCSLIPVNKWHHRNMFREHNS